MEEEKPASGLYLVISLIIAAIVIMAGLAWIYLDYQEYQDGVKARVTFQLSDGNLIDFYCEIADDSQERRQGLMNVTSLEEDAGMLFIFDSPLQVSFWMKNTSIPLDIIFINETGYIVNIEEADPEPGIPDALLTRYESQGPIRWVVEINQGISAANDIVPGTLVLIEY